MSGPLSFDAHVRARLAALENRGLLRRQRTVYGPQDPTFHLDGRRVLSLCSNNYLGFAADPLLSHAATAAVAENGLGSGASRLISGSMLLHSRAEARLARFVDQPDAVLFSSGYAANVGTIQALVGRDDVVFSDALNHASLIDGCRLSRAPTHIYRHTDVDHLEALLRTHRSEGRAALVVTDALFSMDGDAAPLTRLRQLCDRYQAGLFVDEAHSLGVLGSSGHGLCARDAVVPDVLIGTLGKAFGCAGAFAATREPIADLIRNRARSYVFSTAPPTFIPAAALAAADLVEQADDRRSRLTAHTRRLRDGLRSLGLQVLDGASCILPILVGDARETMVLSARLLKRGVFVHGIRPPTVPEGTSRLRVTPIATHTPETLDYALDVFARVLR